MMLVLGGIVAAMLLAGVIVRLLLSIERRRFARMRREAVERRAGR